MKILVLYIAKQAPEQHILSHSYILGATWRYTDIRKIGHDVNMMYNQIHWIASQALKITTLDRTNTTPVVLSHLNFSMTKNIHLFSCIWRASTFPEVEKISYQF